MKTINKTKFAIGSSLIAGLVSACATSEKDPFAQQELSSGYMNQTESATTKVKDGACGEGKCGGKMAAPVEKAKSAEGKCGEGKCGDNKAKVVEKTMEGKCGEGKCGASK